MKTINSLSKIIKRNGDIVDFKEEKITHAIFKAMRDNGIPNRKEAEELCREEIVNITKTLSEKTPTVEKVQDCVERVLFNSGNFELLKAYVLYRKQHEQLRNTKDLFSNLVLLTTICH